MRPRHKAAEYFRATGAATVAVGGFNEAAA